MHVSDESGCGSVFGLFGHCVSTVFVPIACWWVGFVVQTKPQPNQTETEEEEKMVSWVCRYQCSM